MGGQDDTKNLILAVALSALVLIGWYILFPPEIPEPPTPVAEQAGTGQQGSGQANGTAQGTGAAETVVAVDTPVAAVEVVTIEVAGEATAEAVVEDTIVIKRILCRSMLDLVSITI